MHILVLQYFLFYLTDLLYIIANTYEIKFDPLQGSPLVYATIPGDHRFSAICGRNIMYDEEDLTGGIALTIRIHSDDVAFGLEDYGMRQGEALKKLNPLKDIKVPEFFQPQRKESPPYPLGQRFFAVSSSTHRYNLAVPCYAPCPHK